MKKGQIALYAVIAVFLVLSALIAVYVQKQAAVAKLAPSVISPEVKPIDTFVRSCIQQTGRDALVYVGKQGGYYNLPTRSIDGYVYYLYNDKNYMPSKEIIQEQISDYMNEMLYFCTKNFEDFPGAEADPDSIKTETKIINDKVVFDVQWPVTITKTEVYSLNEFSAEIPSRLDVIYNLTELFMADQIEHASSICISCLIKLGIENDVYIDMEDYYENSTIFTITNINSTNGKYSWIFANKYSNEA